MAMRVRGRGGSVLVVGDNKDNPEFLAICLRAEGYKADYVYNDREAIDWIRDNGEPDVIVLNLNIPVMTGIEFMKAYSGPAAIIVSTDEEAKKLPKKPFEVLQKPYSIDKLSSVVARAVRELKNTRKWKRLLPCHHEYINVGLDGNSLLLICMIPGCEKSAVTDVLTLDVETLLELTVDLVGDCDVRETRCACSTAHN